MHEIVSRALGILRRVGGAARSAGRAARPLLPSFRDLHVYGGGALVSLGAHAAWPPAGAIVFGALLVGLGLLKGGR